MVYVGYCNGSSSSVMLKNAILPQSPVIFTVVIVFLLNGTSILFTE